MDRSQVAELHCIVPVANIRSIMTYGLLSHVRASGLRHESCANAAIQARRAGKSVAGRPLHTYVNLYFTARNPMMYTLKDRHETLCVVRVSESALDIPGAMISDINASADYPRFEPSPAGLEWVDYALTFARYWASDDLDFYARIRAKQAKQAEVLIPDMVPPAYLTGVYTSCRAGTYAVREEDPVCGITENPDLFFN